jgi:pimeloyl-ACP methyl ester carboxylesterase
LGKVTVDAVATLLGASLLVASSGCASDPGDYSFEGYLTGHNYSYAVYNNHDKLLHSPIENLKLAMAERPPDRPITDVFVLAHGWNFTVEESFQLYEGYRHSLEPTLKALADSDPKFQPYFIFVVWSSVTRPLSDAARSILPWTQPEWLDASLEFVDAVVFHLPSSWGESQDSARIALGDLDRWQHFQPGPESLHEYPDAITLGMDHARKSGFDGFHAPLSMLIDELIDLKRQPSGPRLHVVGHSFGGKLASLATLDAVQRITATELLHDPAKASEPLVDSLLLIDPAMQLSEMYWDVPLDLGEEEEKKLLAMDAVRDPWYQRPALRFELAAKRIATKAVVYSREDSANGWLFAVSDLLIDHDAVATAQGVGYWRPVDELIYGDEDRAFWVKVVASPIALVYGSLQIVARATHVAVMTVTSDVCALIDGPIAQCEEIADERSDAWEVTKGVVTLPLSPISVQRATGNQGNRFVRSVKSRIGQASWLDASAADYLESSDRVRPDDFLRLTGAAGQQFPDAGDRFLFCDAREVYNGWRESTGAIGGFLDFVAPPGAHGDVRSMEQVDGVAKRVRTFWFVYNVSRPRS